MSETLIRLISFGTIFLLIGFLEWKFPYRMLSCRKGFRWLNNLGVFVIDFITARLLLPILAVGMAEYVYAQQTGLFNLLNLPLWLVAPLGFLALDLAVYAQHRASHNVPWLWRLHRMHHADLDFDMSTAVRFHPIEIVGSMIYKIAVVWLLGIHPNVVLLFEVVLNGTALFNHGNFSIPTQLEGTSLYAMDHGQPVDFSKASGKVILLNDGQKKEIVLTGNSTVLQGEGVELNTPAYTALAAVEFANKKKTTVRFKTK